jgi:outer membrane immunogenic protein
LDNILSITGKINMMKRWVVGLAAIMFMSAGAQAADLSISSQYDWTGFYVGLEGGYGFGNAVHSFSNGAPTDNSRPQGIIGGGFVGYNFQSGPVLFGVEADAELANLNGSFVNLTGISSQGASNLKNQEDLRLRIGLPHDRFLPYLAGGLALGNARFNGGPAGGPICCGYDASLTGYTLGAGVEYAISDRIVTRLEYRYTDFGTSSGGLGPLFSGVTMPVSLQTSEIQFGLSLKF